MFSPAFNISIRDPKENQTLKTIRRCAGIFQRPSIAERHMKRIIADGNATEAVLDDIRRQTRRSVKGERNETVFFRDGSSIIMAATAAGPRPIVAGDRRSMAYLFGRLGKSQKK